MYKIYPHILDNISNYKHISSALAFITMEKQELEKLKKSLLTEKEKIEKELGEMSLRDPSVKEEFDVKFPEYGNTADENAQEISDFERIKAIEVSLEQRLEEIKQTLKRIENGTYGVCTSCSKDIEGKRLKIVPVASLCVSCANQKKK